VHLERPFRGRRLVGGQLLEPELPFRDDLMELLFEWAEADEAEGNGEADDDNNGNQGVCWKINKHNQIKKSATQIGTQIQAANHQRFMSMPHYYNRKLGRIVCNNSVMLG